MKKIILAVAIPLCSAICIAEETDRNFHAEAELGIISTTGNTEASSLNAKLNLKKESEHWLHNFNLEGLYKEDKITDDEGQSETQTTAEKYFASLQSDYKLTRENASLFGYASYADDKFSGFEYQSTLAAGYSDAIFKNDNSHLIYSIGPGYSFTKTEVLNKETNELEDESSSDLIVRIAAEYLYKISDNAKFTQTISSDAATESGKNTKTKAVSALTSKLNGSMALKVSYTVDHNSEVAEDKENTDTQTAVTLVITF